MKNSRLVAISIDGGLTSVPLVIRKAIGKVLPQPSFMEKPVKEMVQPIREMIQNTVQLSQRNRRQDDPAILRTVERDNRCGPENVFRSG